MIILGLGSNLGDRLANLRQAYRALKDAHFISINLVSPVYQSDALLPENAPADWNLPHLNLAIACETSLEPLALLDELKNIEWSIGRKPKARHWGPRILDIDILAWDDRVLESERLTLPHQNLQDRPFALWPLADVAPLWTFPLRGPWQGLTAAQMVEKWGSRFDGKAPFRTQQLYQRIDTPELVGIINVTPDSFSDGGQFIDTEKALAQAQQLVANGATILDIGAESTSPRSKPTLDQTEWQRLQPLLALLMAERHHFIIQPKISIDTRHVYVAEKALQENVDWINDVSGLDDPAMRDLVINAKVDCVIMHHLSIPERREHVLPRQQDPIKTVYEWGEKRIAELVNEGMAPEKIIFDPGIGFGKMAEQSMILLQHAETFKQLGVRLFIGHSRKTFLSLLSGHTFADRDIETLAMALSLLKKPIDYIRVHHVEMCARGIKAACYLNR